MSIIEDFQRRTGLVEACKRLTMDHNVSDTSPCVKGTWITAGHIMSLVMDGWTWSDILRHHPEIDENDICAALTFVAFQDETGEIQVA